RRGQHESLAVVLNFTPVARDGYRIPVAAPGVYQEIFNSDALTYGGSGVENRGDLHTEHVGFNGREHSLRFTLPPLAGVVLRFQS
ncbi:MAG: alpha amylase C-terminal domain-containing protein, partial [Xanthomonadales bacterium]|nr:alpha amylase C-terminal domain-containing protein [Xanthomonadales bacterium]